MNHRPRRESRLLEASGRVHYPGRLGIPRVTDVLTIPEFKAAADRFKFRRFWPVMFVYCLFATPCSLLVLVFTKYLTTVLGVPWVVSLPIAFGALIVVLIPTSWILGRIMNRRSRRDPHLVCPHCERFLALAERGRVIATRSCPGCSGRILAEPEAPSAEIPLRPRAEVVAIDADLKRRVRILIGGWACLSVAWIASFAWGNGLVGMCLFVNGFPLLLALHIWAIQPLNLLACPHCKAWCYPGLALRTERCGKCGQPVLADSPADAARVGVAEESPRG